MATKGFRSHLSSPFSGFVLAQEKFHGVPCWFQLGTVSCRCTYHEHGLNPVDRGAASSDLVGFCRCPEIERRGARSPAAKKPLEGTQRLRSFLTQRG